MSYFTKMSLTPRLLLGLLVCLMNFGVSYGNGIGAPAGACTSLTPDPSAHAPSPQSSTPPYGVVLSQSQYTSAGDTIDVTIEGRCDMFKGFLIVARLADGSSTVPQGEFTQAAGTQKRCTNGADSTLRGLTHTSATDKQSLTLRWTAPGNVGHIVFWVTFVKTRTVFWTNVKSDVLSDTTKTPLTPAEIAAIGIVTAAPATCTTLAPTTQPTNTGAITRDSNCGSTLGCFDDCNGNTCSMTVSWRTEGTNTRFTVKAKAFDNAYVAVGFSRDSAMGEDSVAECVIVAGVVSAFQSYNGGRFNTRLTTATAAAGITLVNGGVTDGVFECTFLRVTSGTADQESFDINQNYFIFAAQGPASAGSISKHNAAPLLSLTVADFQSTDQLTVAVLSYPLVKTHASFMALAWMLFASIGLIMPRFFKPLWPDRTFMGVKIWFVVHRVLMASAMLFTVIGFIVIFVEVGGYSQIVGANYLKAHPILGIIVTALVIINPIMATFRCAPDHDKRIIFNWAHAIVGRVAHVLSVVAIFFGTSLSKAQTPTFLTYILWVYVGWQVLVEIGLEVVRCAVKPKEKSFDINLDNPTERGRAQPSGTIYYIVLGVHIVVLLCLSFAVVGVVAASPF